MKQANRLSTKNRSLRTVSLITLVLLILATLSLFYDLYAYLEIKAKSSGLEKISNFIGAGFIIQVLLLLSFALLMLKSFRTGLKAGNLVIAAIIAGAISAILLIFNFAALEDISNDYLLQGYDCTLEWIWLFSSLLFRFVFYIILSQLIFRILKGIKELTASPASVVDEIMFEVTQYIGIVCGFIGLAFTVYAYVALGNFAISSWLLWLLTFYFLAIVLPWFLLIIYWIIRLSRKTKLTLYDEKQKQDFASSGMITWLTSIPLMVILLIISLKEPSSPGVFLWFPTYLFFTLLVFSASLLVKFKRE
ncbi:MAG: hypothetical protein P1P83_09800 [Bacteroidales bacterium]|nr:hypothetical protein [Bacteroidales bacterium]MDT8373013.1 hypothetical protein [Bacteroidales bacterium]